MFQKERLIEECRAALKESNAQAVIRELVAGAVSDPKQVIRVLGKPKISGVETIYRADDLIILNLCWGPPDGIQAARSSHVGRHRHLRGS